jgi:hypothetical protein
VFGLLLITSSVDAGLSPGEGSELESSPYFGSLNINIWIGVVALALAVSSSAVVLTYYVSTRRHPLTVRLSETPGALLTVDLEDLPKACRLLRHSRQLDAVIRSAGTSKIWLDAAVRFAKEQCPYKRADLLAARLGTTVTLVAAKSTSELASFRLELPQEFPLNVPSCLVFFPKASQPGGEVLSVVQGLAQDEPVSVIVASNTEQYAHITNASREYTETIIVPRSSELSRLLLAPRPIESFAWLISSRVRLSLISPYQVNEGVRNDRIFFGRRRELTHILNRDPSNYIVLGARQLGKSSLLKAVERRVKARGDLAVDYRVVGRDSVIAVLARAAGLPDTAPWGQTMTALRQPDKGRARLLLLDEADAFVEADAKAKPPFPILSALQSLSAEGRCFFILAGFWKLFEVVHADYFAPVHNFGETIRLGSLEEDACLDLLRKPMTALGIRYALTAYVGLIVDETGRRPNLMQIICSELVRRLGTRRVIEPVDIQDAFDSTAVSHALEDWGRLTTDSRAARLDRIVVWAMLEEDDFSLETVLDRMERYGIAARVEEVRASMVRLDLAFILGESGGFYRWRVPLF